MIWGMNFKPIVENISLKQGDGNQYASHVSEIIDQVITNFIISIHEVSKFNSNDGEIFYKQASIAIDEWLKTMRKEVNNKNQSVTWAKNLLVLLVKTLDSVKDWHPYLLILDKCLKSILPKHYNLN